MFDHRMGRSDVLPVSGWKSAMVLETRECRTGKQQQACAWWLADARSGCTCKLWLPDAVGSHVSGVAN